MMLVQTSPSPTLRMPCATFPCGCGRDQKRRWYRASNASGINRIGRQITDGWKVLRQRRQGCQHCQQRLGGSGLNDQSVAFFSHDGLLTPKFELTGDPHCPIAAIPKDSDVTFWTHNEPPPSICLSRCQTISYVHSGKDFSLAYNGVL